MRQTWRQKFESFKNGSWRKAHLASPAPSPTPDPAEPTSDERFTSRRTLYFGRYYIVFGRDPVSKPASSQCCVELSGDTCASYSKSGSCTSELPDYDSLFAVLPLVSCEKSTPELSASRSLQELPDPASMETGTLERHAVYELDSIRLLGDGSQYSPKGCDVRCHFDEQQEYAPPGMKHQGFAPMHAPALRPRQRTYESLNVVPSLIRADNSHTPSPISPVTPSLQIADCAEVQQQADVSPISTRMSQYQPSQLLLQYGTNELAPQYSPSVLFHPGNKSALTSTQAAQFPCARPMLGCYKHDSHHNAHFTPSSTLPAHFIPSHRSFDQGAAVPDDLRWSSGVYWNDTDPNLMMNSNNMSAQTHHITRSDECFDAQTAAVQRNEGASVCDAGLDDGDHTFRYPKEMCSICGGEFTGKYGRGNLARHIRDKHGMRSMEGRICRICRQVYNRPDARRKHEWKKHRLQDVKPNKRHK